MLKERVNSFLGYWEDRWDVPDNKEKSFIYCAPPGHVRFLSGSTWGGYPSSSLFVPSNTAGIPPLILADHANIPVVKDVSQFHLDWK